jgi:hypothetical protein
MFAEYGVSQHLLQVAVMFIIIACILAMFWQQILIGGAMVFGLVFVTAVFANHEPATTVAKVPAEIVKEVPVEKQEEKVKDELTEQEMFMQDCQKVTGYTESQCSAIWNNDEKEQKTAIKGTEREPKFLKVRNESPS